MVDQGTAILRLCIAFGLAFVLGLERELRGQVAGLRTHILVCLGACLFTLCSILAAHPLEAGMPQDVRADITRIASQVVVGIGFLGGGAILRHGATIKGLTTAANLWLTASVGLAVGLGYPVLAAATVGFSLVTLVGLRFLENVIRRFRKKFRLVTEDNLAARAKKEDDEDPAQEGE